MTGGFDTTVVRQAHDRLLANDKLLAGLLEHRGWTRQAIEQLSLGQDGDRILIPVADQHLNLVGLLRYQPSKKARGDAPKMLATPGSSRELFPPVEALDPGATVWLVEGEADAVAATSAGLAATGIPGTSSWKPEWAGRFEGRDVVICCDCDQPGRSAAARAADDLLEHARTVRIIDLAPVRDDGYDLGDLVAETNGQPAQALPVLARMAEHAPVHVAEKDRPPRPRLTIGDWQRSLTDFIDGKLNTPAWPIPFEALREATDGGIRPGELWVLAGYTSHGKSIYGDMLLDKAAAAGARCHLYMTEMTVVQRGLRRLARASHIPFARLRKRDLTTRELDQVRREIAALPYAASVVTDWTPQQVATDIRVTGTQVAVIDLLHGFHYQDERELSAFVETFASAATTDATGHGTGAAVVLLCHLNDAQMRDARSPARPKPGMHSLKGASSIKQRADVVMFAWLKDDEEGLPTADGEVWIAKNRNGALESQDIKLDVGRLMFIEKDRRSAA